MGGKTNKVHLDKDIEILSLVKPLDHAPDCNESVNSLQPRSDWKPKQMIDLRGS